MKDDELWFIKKFGKMGIFDNPIRLLVCYSFIIFNIVITYTQVMYLYHVWGDISRMMGITATFTVAIQATFKAFMLRVNRSRLIKLHGLVETEFWDCSIANLEVENNLTTRLKHIAYLFYVHLGLCMFAVAIFAMFPLTDEEDPEIRTLPIQTWIPFDTNPSPRFEVIYFFLGANCVACVISLLVSDLNFFYLSQHLLIQFELLQHVLANLMYDVVDIKEDILKYDNSTFQKIIHQRFLVYYRHHLKLLSFGRELQEYTSIGMAMHFLVCTMALVIIMYILSANTEEFSKSFKLGIFFIATSVQVVMFSHYGSELQAESANTATAAYLSQWYLGNAAFRKNLNFLQIIARKETKISAVGCLDINNTTLVSVYRNAFSLVTLLRSLEYSRSN